MLVKILDDIENDTASLKEVLSSLLEHHDELAVVDLVDQILAAKKSGATVDASALEREIDERVYRLYGLTPDEIKIVEETRHG